MALTPCHTDPNRAKELERRKQNPDSFGVGDRRATETAQKTHQNGQR